MKGLLKQCAFVLALAVVLPAWLSFSMRRLILGRNRALTGSSQALSLVPGIIGQYVRRAFYWLVLDRCDPSVTIEFGSLFSKANIRIEAGVYIGPGCHIGQVWIERDVIIAAGVHIPSGPDTHGSIDTTTPIRDQEGQLRTVRIGAGSWIASHAVVMADVGTGSIVAAGAVVTEPVPDMVVAGGVPAKVLKQRRS